MQRQETGKLNVRRNVAVVGGILGLEQRYRRILAENNLAPRIYNKGSARLRKKVEGVDIIILFTGTVSHKMAEAVRRVAGTCAIPVLNVIPSSLSALKKSIENVSV